MDDSQRKLVAEFFGTFALIFFGAGSALLGADVVGQALANGLAIGLMVTAVGHISGGHFNPAVTLSMLVTRRIETRRGRALLGLPAGRRRGCGARPARDLSADTGNLGSPAVGGPGFSTGNALVAEIVGTFFLVFVIYARRRGQARCVQHPRRPAHRPHDQHRRARGRRRLRRRVQPGALVRAGARLGHVGQLLDLDPRTRRSAPSWPRSPTTGCCSRAPQGSSRATAAH